MSLASLGLYAFQTIRFYRLRAYLAGLAAHSMVSLGFRTVLMQA